jgi:hypothetical protein
MNRSLVILLGALVLGAALFGGSYFAGSHAFDGRLELAARRISFERRRDGARSEAA